jgi:hypothetical protein
MSIGGAHAFSAGFVAAQCEEFPDLENCLQVSKWASIHQERKIQGLKPLSHRRDYGMTEVMP